LKLKVELERIAFESKTKEKKINQPTKPNKAKPSETKQNKIKTKQKKKRKEKLAGYFVFKTTDYCVNQSKRTELRLDLFFLLSFLIPSHFLLIRIVTSARPLDIHIVILPESTTITFSVSSLFVSARFQ